MFMLALTLVFRNGFFSLSGRSFLQAETRSRYTIPFFQLFNMGLEPQNFVRQKKEGKDIRVIVLRQPTEQRLVILLF